MINYQTILSPLDQFEIRNLFSVDTPLLANMNLSITNIGLYMTIAAFIAFYFSILATNHSKITPNKWSLSQETLYATIHSIVVNQINNKNGQVYFPFMYVLFIFILINNLIGMVRSDSKYLIDHNFSLCSLIISNKKVSANSFIKNSKCFTKYRSYSTSSLKNIQTNDNGILGNVMDPYHLTGFIDGEGCFNRKYSTSSSNNNSKLSFFVPVVIYSKISYNKALIIK